MQVESPSQAVPDMEQQAMPSDAHYNVLKIVQLADLKVSMCGVALQSQSVCKAACEVTTSVAPRMLGPDVQVRREFIFFARQEVYRVTWTLASHAESTYALLWASVVPSNVFFPFTGEGACS